MDDRERIPILRADAHLEAHGGTVAGVDVDDAAHLEPAHLAGDHAVLDHHRRAGRLDVVDEGEVCLRRARWSANRGRRHGASFGAVQRPDADRKAELPGAPSGDAQRFVGDDVELGGAVANRPDDRRTETDPVVDRGVEQHPRPVVGDEGRSRRE